MVSCRFAGVSYDWCFLVIRGAWTVGSAATALHGCGAVSVICPWLLGFHVIDMSAAGKRAAGKTGRPPIR